MLVFSYDMEIDEINMKIDGLVIPGGRDIDPRFYNQEDKGSKLDEDSLKRYPKMKHIYENITPEIPIFAICWGFQFLNIVHGGTLNQHMADSEAHFTQRRMQIREKSWFHEIVGDTMIGQCYHH